MPADALEVNDKVKSLIPTDEFTGTVTTVWVGFVRVDFDTPKGERTFTLASSKQLEYIGPPKAAPLPNPQVMAPLPIPVTAPPPLAPPIPVVSLPADEPAFEPKAKKGV